jgi:hypothetical protein
LSPRSSNVLQRAHEKLNRAAKTGLMFRGLEGAETYENSVCTRASEASSSALSAAAVAGDCRGDIASLGCSRRGDAAAAGERTGEEIGGKEGWDERLFDRSSCLLISIPFSRF